MTIAKTITYAVPNTREGREFADKVEAKNGYGVNHVYTKVYAEEPGILYIWYKENVDSPEAELADNLNDFLMNFVHNSPICAKCNFNHGIYGCYFAEGCVANNMKMYQGVKNV